MLIDQRDIQLLEQQLDVARRYYGMSDLELEKTNFRLDDLAFFVNNPQIILSLGFGEARAFCRSAPLTPPDSWKRAPLVSLCDWAFPQEVFFRESSTGLWAWLEGMTNADLAHPTNRKAKSDFFLHFMTDPIGATGWHETKNSVGTLQAHRSIAVSDALKALRHLVERQDSHRTTLISSQLWTPSKQSFVKLELAESVHDILRAIDEGNIELSGVRPREMEELVAELLRSRGMEINVTKRTRDGGRDVIARGELVPGEPTIMAVEVKQKPVVGLADLQRTLKANEDFPCVLIATSGRFSVGVLRERERDRHHMRVILKSGIALRQWIRLWQIALVPCL